MKVTLLLDKSLEENASLYFEKAKTAKKKLEGALAALERTRREMARVEKTAAVEEREGAQTPAKREWYEKYHHFRSSEGILCIGGRDASTNEILIKKHAGHEDVVFHSEVPGSPFFVVKSSAPGQATLDEAAVATACYSRAWRLGIGNVEVYWIKGSQVSKEAPSGEYMGKGSFMVRGKRNQMTVIPEMAVTMHDGTISAGPLAAMRALGGRVVEVLPGNTKTSEVAKAIRKTLGGGNLDEIVRALPAGGCKLKGEKQ